jgi:hypothetical protein
VIGLVFILSLEFFFTFARQGADKEGKTSRPPEVLASFWGSGLTLGWKWRGHIDQVGGKILRLLGVLGMARADLDERLTS